MYVCAEERGCVYVYVCAELECCVGEEGRGTIGKREAGGGGGREEEGGRETGTELLRFANNRSPNESREDRRNCEVNPSW